MTLQNYRLATHRSAITMIPICVSILYSVFIILDSGYLYLKALWPNPSFFSFVIPHIILSAPIIVSTIYAFWVHSAIHKQSANRFTFIPIVSYAVTLGIFFLENFVLTLTPLKYTSIAGQIGFTAAMLVLGNCFTWRYYVPANFIEILFIFVGSFWEQMIDGKTGYWNPFLEGNSPSIYFLPITTFAFMTVCTFLNRVSEMDDKKNYKIVLDLRWAKCHDPMTGAYNRQMLKMKYMSDRFFMILDIDYFKKLNDRFGHDMGDKCLKKFVKILKDNTRPEDSVIRYGGEEFLVIVEGPSTKIGIQDFAERIRAAVEEETSRIKDMSDPEFVAPFTVSIGVGYVDTRFTLEENIKVADEYLYESKERGRNCVTSILNSKHPW